MSAPNVENLTDTSRSLPVDKSTVPAPLPPPQAAQDFQEDPFAWLNDDQILELPQMDDQPEFNMLNLDQHHSVEQAWPWSATQDWTLLDSPVEVSDARQRQYTHLTGLDDVLFPTNRQYTHLTGHDDVLFPESRQHVTDQHVTSPLVTGQHLTGQHYTHLTGHDDVLFPENRHHVNDQHVTGQHYTHITGLDDVLPSERRHNVRSQHPYSHHVTVLGPVHGEASQQVLARSSLHRAPQHVLPDVQHHVEELQRSQGYTTKKVDATHYLLSHIPAFQGSLNASWPEQSGGVTSTPTQMVKEAEVSRPHAQGAHLLSHRVNSPVEDVQGVPQAGLGSLDRGRINVSGVPSQSVLRTHRSYSPGKSQQVVRPVDSHITPLSLHSWALPGNSIAVQGSVPSSTNAGRMLQHNASSSANSNAGIDTTRSAVTMPSTADTHGEAQGPHVRSRQELASRVGVIYQPGETSELGNKVGNSTRLQVRRAGPVQSVQHIPTDGPARPFDTLNVSTGNVASQGTHDVSPTPTPRAWVSASPPSPPSTPMLRPSSPRSSSVSQSGRTSKPTKDGHTTPGHAEEGSSPAPLTSGTRASYGKASVVAGVPPSGNALASASFSSHFGHLALQAVVSACVSAVAVTMVRLYAAAIVQCTAVLRMAVGTAVALESSSQKVRSGLACQSYSEEWSSVFGNLGRVIAV